MDIIWAPRKTNWGKVKKCNISKIGYFKIFPPKFCNY